VHTVTGNKHLGLLCYQTPHKLRSVFVSKQKQPKNKQHDANMPRYHLTKT